MKVKLIDLPRYHVFGLPKDPFDKIYILNEAHKGGANEKPYFEWHRVNWDDGRAKLMGDGTNDREWLSKTDVIDRGHFKDWMKANHPIRYKRENWENRMM